MTYEQVINFFKDKDNYPCPITDKLINSGYKQPCNRRGYTNDAKKLGMENPTQWWHIMYYCQSKEDKSKNYRWTPCGELIFWMAEFSGAVNKEQLEELYDKIKDDTTHRRKWNSEISKICWENIKDTIGN